MFDANQFKRSVKVWMREHPNGTEIELTDFCEEQIPPNHFTAQHWLIEHTVSWYRYVLSQRRHESSPMDDGDEDSAVN